MAYAEPDETAASPYSCATAEAVSARLRLPSAGAEAADARFRLLDQTRCDNRRPRVYVYKRSPERVTEGGFARTRRRKLSRGFVFASRRRPLRNASRRSGSARRGPIITRSPAVDRHTATRDCDPWRSPRYASRRIRSTPTLGPEPADPHERETWAMERAAAVMLLAEVADRNAELLRHAANGECAARGARDLLLDAAQEC